MQRTRARTSTISAYQAASTRSRRADVARRGAGGGDGAGAAHLHDGDDRREEEEHLDGDEQARGSNPSHAGSSASGTHERERGTQLRPWQPRPCSSAKRAAARRAAARAASQAATTRPATTARGQRQLLPCHQELEATRPPADPTTRWAAASVAATSASKGRRRRMDVGTWNVCGVHDAYAPSYHRLTPRFILRVGARR